MTALEQWQKLSVMQRRLAAGVSLVVGVWLVNLIGLGPLRQDIRRLRDQVRDTEQRLMRAVSVNTQAATILQAFEAYRSYVPGSVSEGDAAHTQSQVQSDVEAAVRASGMSLLNVKPVSASTHDGASTVSVALELEATPEQLIRLLDSLQRSTQLLKVTQMAMRLTDERALTLRCSMVITKLLLTPLPAAPAGGPASS